MTNEEILQRLGRFFPGAAGRELYTVLAAINAEAAGAATDVATVGASVDAMATKLNADTGVADTDYAGSGL